MSLHCQVYIGGNQRWTEIHAWTSLCLGMNIRSYVELGIGSSYLLANAGIPSVTVDILPDSHSNHIQGNSHDKFIVEQVVDKLGCFPDVTFIDADHETLAVYEDFNLWWPVTKYMVGFHDILMPSVEPFWQDVRRRYPSLEIISRDPGSANQWQVGSGSNGDLNCGGIGVLFREIERGVYDT